MSIRPARCSDINALAALYAGALPDDLPCRLGSRFLRHLFATLLDDPRNCATIAERDGAAVGFCIISADSRQVNRRLLPGLILELLRQPIVAAQLIRRNLTISFLRSLWGRPADQLAGQPEVYLIGLSAAARGSGLGSELLSAALAQSGRVTGDDRCIARTRNPQAVAFYVANGFVPVGTERRGDAVLTVLLKS